MSRSSFLVALSGIALPLAPLVAVAVFVLRAPLRISGDCAVYLQCGELLLDGAVPYVDFFEINPPLIMYLSAMPVLIARWLAVNPIPVFSFLVLALATWSTLRLRSQLARVWPSAQRVGSWILPSLWAASSLYVWALGDFGQREHLFVLLFFPFLVLRWLRCSGVSIPSATAVVLGLAAGVGISIKPHFIAIAVAAELYWVLSHRRLRHLATPELVALVCAPVLYAAHFFFVPGTMWDSFFHRWVPFIAQHYAVYDLPLAAIIDRSVVLWLLVSIAALAVGVVRSEPLARLAGALGACTLTSVALYVLQQKGWYYQKIPALAGVVVLAGIGVVVILQALLTRIQRDRSRRFATGVLIGIAWVGTALFISRVRVAVPEDDPETWIGGFTESIEAFTHERESVLFVSTSIEPAYPTLVRVNRRPASRYLWFFPVPMLYEGESTYRREEFAPAEERRFLRELAQDIAAYEPPLIFVRATAGCRACPPAFNLLTYLEDSRVVAAALRAYRPIGRVFEYEAYVRRDRFTTNAALDRHRSP